MHTTNLRKVGGSVMLTVPRRLLDMLELGPGSQVGLAIENGRLMIEPVAKPCYTLAELLAQCDPRAEVSAEDREWTQGDPVGNELI